MPPAADRALARTLARIESLRARTAGPRPGAGVRLVPVACSRRALARVVADAELVAVARGAARCRVETLHYRASRARAAVRPAALADRVESEAREA